MCDSEARVKVRRRENRFQLWRAQLHDVHLKDNGILFGR